MGSSSQSSGNDRDSIRTLSVLVLLCIVITLVLSQFVGNKSLYGEQLEARRDAAHQAILRNDPTSLNGSWFGDTGGNSINIRILPVYAAEIIHRASGLDYRQVYKLIDMVTLFLSLLLLYQILRKTNSSEYCFIGILFFGVAMTMTYSQHYFHPWDKPGILFWLLFAGAARDGRFLVATLIMIFAVFNKYDSIVLPALYFLIQATSVNWRSTAVKTALMFLVAFGTYAGLRVLLPGGFEEKDIGDVVMRNINMILKLNYGYPPLLGFAVPFVLAWFGWRRAERFAKASFVFAVVILLGPLFLLSQFEEIRAEMGVLALMLPLAVVGLRELLAADRQPVAQQ